MLIAECGDNRGGRLLAGTTWVRMAAALTAMAGLVGPLRAEAGAETAAADLPAAVPADIAEMKVEDLRAGGDERKRFFVIRRPGEPPATGWRALFVLPGGSGDAGFQPFVTRLAKFALPDSYLVIQLVAPVWSPEASRSVVWPSDRLRVDGMKFTTAEFFLAVRAAVEKSHRLDPRHIRTLTWSSSGMSGYELSLLPRAGVTGTFVAMSVFHPKQLPALSRAKGHPYFLFHSRQDFIPFAQSEAARDALTKAGAAVELRSYEGGHGWHGDVMGAIRSGIEWLEANSRPK